MRAICFMVVALSFTGCAHHQLQVNTVNHAGTLSDVYEHQVLNNLARFVANPESIPHFELPTSGGTNVNDTASISSGAFNAFRLNVGGSVNRVQQNAWTLQPVTNPDRIRRMKCAFQRAVNYQSANCDDCCELEKPFIVTPAVIVDTIFDENGKRRLDPITGKPYSGVTYIDEVMEYDANGNSTGNRVKVYRPASSGDGDPTHPVLTPGFAVDSDGNNLRQIYYYEYSIGVKKEVKRQPYDCNSPCAVQPCWFKCSTNRWTAAKESGGKFGRYRGTYVWVPKCGRAEFSKLVLTVLDYATTDPPPTLTKEVTLYLDHYGQPSDPESASQVIRRVIPAGAENIALEAGKIQNKKPSTEPEATLEIDRIDLDAKKLGLRQLQSYLQLTLSTDESDKERGKELFEGLRDRTFGFSDLYLECESCIDAADDTGIRAKIDEIDSFILDLDRQFQEKQRGFQLESLRQGVPNDGDSRARNENERIQKGVPFLRETPRADFFREFDLRQNFLLPNNR